MHIVRSPRAMTRLSERWRARGESVGFVPTMGSLHAAHMSLTRRARRENRRVVVSVFVNPIQFGPKEDFARYPRPFRADAARCRAARVDAVYHPSGASMYPDGFSTRVEVDGLSGILCGKSRPGHFRGVATVVLKLLQQVRPHRVYLGEKDYQQLVVLRRMARDLDVPARVVGCRIVREPDGLAMSSRNAYLSGEERRLAPRFYRALARGARSAGKRGASSAGVLASVRRELRGIPGARLEYVELVDADTLERVRRLKGKRRLLAALRFRNTRLIDNVPLNV